MEKLLTSVFKNICKSNREQIKRGMSINPVCFIVTKSEKVFAVAMIFRNRDEKIIMRRAIKDFLLKQKIRGYIMVSDCKMTVMDRNGKNLPEVLDVVMTNAYTPKEKKTDIFSYKDKKIKRNKELEELGKIDRKKSRDEWDLWNTSEDNFDKETERKYQEFKEANKELFKSVE